MSSTQGLIDRLMAGAATRARRFLVTKKHCLKLELSLTTLFLAIVGVLIYCTSACAVTPIEMYIYTQAEITSENDPLTSQNLWLGWPGEEAVADYKSGFVYLPGNSTISMIPNGNVIFLIVRDTQQDIFVRRNNGMPEPTHIFHGYYAMNNTGRCDGISHSVPYSYATYDMDFIFTYTCHTIDTSPQPSPSLHRGPHPRRLCILRG